jgi:hypothetical protein
MSVAPSARCGGEEEESSDARSDFSSAGSADNVLQLGDDDGVYDHVPEFEGLSDGEESVEVNNGGEVGDEGNVLGFVYAEGLAPIAPADEALAAGNPALCTAFADYDMNTFRGSTAVYLPTGDGAPGRLSESIHDNLHLQIVTLKGIALGEFKWTMSFEMCAALDLADLNAHLQEKVCLADRANLCTNIVTLLFVLPFDQAGEQANDTNL